MLIPVTNYIAARRGARDAPLPLISAENTPEAMASAVRTVLVVDDEQDAADIAELLLRAHGFETRVAYSAREALSILIADPAIDAVFSDIRMPGISGLELASTIKELYPAVKVVLTSGYVPAGLLAMRMDIPPFLIKPYSIDAVVAALRDQTS